MDTGIGMDIRLMELMSGYLIGSPDGIRPDAVAELCGAGVDEHEAVSLLLAAELGLDVAEDARDRALYRECFPRMLHRLDAAEYERNDYYQTVRFAGAKKGGWTLTQQSYKPYEAFVCDDIQKFEDGLRLPQIGYFSGGFRYPAVLENGRLWMSVTPNEINTMAAPLNAAGGKVLTFGLGLGYFAYMASQKLEVESVTVVERSAEAIALFNEHLLPQFPRRDKISIVRADAFEYARANYPTAGYDFIFTDLWHDVSDGLPLYMEMKRLEPLAPRAVHAYWIEPTLRCYI